MPASGPVYAGFIGDEGPERIRQAYPGETWDHLQSIKLRYDPTNVFRRNHNVPPAVLADRSAVPVWPAPVTASRAGPGGSAALWHWSGASLGMKMDHSDL